MGQDGDSGRRAGQPNRRLAVRMLVARLAWLDGVPVWSGGRIAWEGGEGGVVSPGPSDLARAQRCLHKLRQYPRAAPLVLGDSLAWLEERRQRLEHVKRLAALHELDIPALIGRAEAGDGDALGRLAALSPAEAVCVNPLPASPCRALTALGPRAAPLLTAQAQDSAALPETRCLAALTLGAIHGRAEGGRLPPFTGSGGESRAYGWGRRHGLPPDPALAAALLAEEGGNALVARCLAATAPDLPLALMPEHLRRLVRRGVSPERVTALAEAVAEARPLAARLARYREELPDRRAAERRKAARALNEQRQGVMTVIADLYREYAMMYGDPTVVSSLTAFLFSMLDLAPPSEQWTAAVSAMLDDGLTLPPALAAAYLGLLTDRHDRQEGRPPLPTEPKDAVKHLIWRAEVRHKWLPQRCRDARSLCVLLGRTGDAEIAREALALRVHRVLDDYDWSDPDKYRRLLALLASLPQAGRETYRLCDLVDGLGDAGAVRAAINPVMAALHPETPAVRAVVWNALLDEIGWDRSARRKALPRLGRCAPSLAAFARQSKHPDHLAACLGGLMALDPSWSEAASAWLDRMLADLLAREARGDAGLSEEVVRTAAVLASALGAGDPDRMMDVFRASLGHALHIEEGRLEQGLSLLGRFPAARAPLAALFPQQPRRCAALLVRLGLTARLGAEALAPLRRLAPSRTDTSFFPVPLGPDGGWWRLHRACPELSSEAASYRHACWVHHQRPALPPGVRQALAQPQRRAEELAHLERSAAGRPEIGKRMDRLRALLDAPEQMQADVRAAVRERLPRLNAEAQMAALEHQMEGCYRARLEELTGPLPAGLILSDDLINAVLLAADLTQNRRLLLRLLRAHLAGEPRWRESHPDNVRFLDSLTAQGADVGVWLSARPRRYPCAGAAGGRVRLWLERDPLHVLQMGNYFDTCLSFDDFNAFSTVANACELNKRVIYARDGAGHVVGRKLIGVSGDGALVGFRTYTSLTGKAENASLQAVIRHYAAAFAADCGLPLADTGTVPTLFAEAWYDDGTAAWDGEGTPPARSGILKA